MKFKIIYDEPGVINLTTYVNADTANSAVIYFLLENPDAEVTKIEVVEDD